MSVEVQKIGPVWTFEFETEEKIEDIDQIISEFTLTAPSPSENTMALQKVTNPISSTIFFEGGEGPGKLYSIIMTAYQQGKGLMCSEYKHKDSSNTISEQVRDIDQIISEFTLMNAFPSAENKTLQKVIVPKFSTMFFESGEGPGMLGTFYSISMTVYQLARSLVREYEHEEINNPIEKTAQKRVALPGRMLCGSNVCRFIEIINKDYPINTIHNFYLKGGSGINTYTLQEIKKIIDNNASAFDNPNLPICMPIVFQGHTWWERNHMASIIIKDGCVEFCDPKGIPSKKRKLKDEEHSLRDVLEYCREKFTDGEGEITEDPITKQFNIHGCGLFALRHILSRIVEGVPMGTLEIGSPEIYHIEDFRQIILDIAYNKTTEDAEERRETTHTIVSLDDI